MTSFVVVMYNGAALLVQRGIGLSVPKLADLRISLDHISHSTGFKY